MEFGILYDLRNPPAWSIPRQELYAQTLDHAQAMEDLGFPVVWVTEHHFIDDEYLPSCLPFAAALAARTNRVTIGTAVLLLPLHDPLRVAEDAAVVDVLANGRLRLGLGLGYKLEEFEVFGVDRASRAARMEEGIAVLRGAWADGPFSHEGRHYRIPSVDVTPKPVQRPGPPIWLAGRGPKPTERAARLGDGLIATPGTEIYAQFRRQWAEYGRTGTPPLCTFAFTYPTHDPARAARELGPHAAYRMDNYARWYGEAGDLEVDRRLQQVVEATGRGPMAAESFFGTPEQVIAEVAALEAMGVTSLLYFGGLPGRPMADTVALFEVLAREVMPAFSR